MEKFRRYVADNKILYRMIAFYTIVCMSIVLMTTTAMYSRFSSEIRDEIYRSQVQSLKQISNTVSFRAEYASDLMVQVKTGQLTSKLFYSSDFDVAVQAIEWLDALRRPVKQLDSIYIYNESEDLIYYSGVNRNRIPSVNSVGGFVDRGFVEILENIENYPKHTPIPRKVSFENYNGQLYETYVYTYLLYDEYSSGRIRNIVALNFHLGWVKDALSFISAEEQGKMESIMIVDHDRQVIYSSDEYLIGTQIEHELFPDNIFESEAGYVITGSGDNRKMLVYSTPPYSGYDNWTFLSRNDYSAIIGPMERVRDFVYVVGFVAIVLSLLLIVALSRVLYKPVRHVLNRVEVLEKENKEKLKLERIQFLRKLFIGNVPDDLQVIKDSFAQYQVGPEIDDDIRVLLVSVDYINSYYRQIGSEIEAADSRIEKVLEKCCKTHYERHIYAKMQNGIWAVCVPVRKENEKYDSLFEELNQALKHMNLSISIAVSSVGHSERDIPYLYSEVVDTHSYLYLLGQNRIITAEDIQDQGQSKFEYPNEAEKKFLSQLFGGKDEDAVEAYEEFVTAIRAYTVEEIRMSFMILAYSVKNTSQKTMAETSSILVEFDRFYKKLQEVETIDEVHHMFHNLIEEITDKQKLYSKERYERLIDQIKSYVESNYGDLSLSVNQVADHVNMSAAYLGRVFKQFTGITFTEYLTKFRLDIACSLLKETNLTVNEISDQIGFTNSSYFHIIFKKNLNCTPNQYRKQCKITV